MEHEKSCLSGNILDAVFCNIILVMTANTTASQELFISVELVYDLLCCVDSIVCVVALDVYTYLTSLPLKSKQGLKG